jgi:hypothetical protein
MCESTYAAEKLFVFKEVLGCGNLERHCTTTRSTGFHVVSIKYVIDSVVFVLAKMCLVYFYRLSCVCAGNDVSGIFL